MKNILSHTLVVVLASAPLLAHAQSEEPSTPTPAPGKPYAPAAPTSDLEAKVARLDGEVKALRAELAEKETAAALAKETELLESERRLRIYGFADIGLQRVIQHDDSFSQATYSTPLSFYLGRLNLYFDSRPAQDFRFLAETRFSLYPRGGTTMADATPISTTIYDSSSPNPWANVSWGSIILERAHLDYTRYQLLSVRVGYFLTPFGIYNVDHGSPTLISMALPAYLTLDWIPQRQLGIQVYGSYPVERWELGYAATVGNGQSLNEIRDIGDSKALGGRLFARRQGKLRLQLGASALYRPYRTQSMGWDSTFTTFRVTRDVERDDLTLGLDQSLDYGGLRIRNEMVFYKTKYTPGKRDAGMFGETPNTRQINTFTLVSYRLFDVEPYLQFNYFHSSPDSFYTNCYVPGAGFNIYLRPNVILKAQWIYIRFQKNDDPLKTAENSSPHIFNGLLVWAF